MGDVTAVAAGHAHGLGQFVFGHDRVEFLLAGQGEHFDEEPPAAVADGGLVGVELDERVVDAAAAQGREEMLDGMDFHAPLAEGRGALDLLDVIDVGSNGRLVGQIDALENVAGVRRGGLDREGDVGAGMQG